MSTQTASKKLSWVLILIGVGAILIVGYIAACSRVQASTDQSFNMVSQGDSEASALGVLDTPSRIETPATPFTRYASVGCQAPCSKRLWYENRLAFDTMAWSIDLDASGKVIKKAKWNSP
jgi:hypothetical protein